MILSARPLRIGIMGGTFDPTHHGHLIAASEVQNVFALDEVIFVPTQAQLSKKECKVSPTEHQYLMTVITTASNSRLTVSRVDIDRGRTTYTIDTLHDIAAKYPGTELYFITGADALVQILTWKDSGGIFGLVHLVGVTRPGHVPSDSGVPRDRISLVEMPVMAISSTDCRQRVGEGSSVWYLIPDGVVQYIRKCGLYRMTLRPASATLMTARAAREQSLRKGNDGEH